MKDLLLRSPGRLRQLLVKALLMACILATPYLAAFAQVAECFELEGFGIVGGGSEACDGGTVTFRADVQLDEGATVFRYSWFRNGNFVEASRNSNTYTINNVSASDEGNWQVNVSVFCRNNRLAQVTSQPISLEVVTAPDPAIVATPGQELNCEVNSISLRVANFDNNASYSWQGPGLTSSAREVEVSQAGTYTVRVTANGCTTESSSEVVDNRQYKPSASAGNDIVLARCGQNVSMDASTSSNGGKGNLRYAWDGPGFTYSGNNSKVQVNDAQSGTYTLTVTNLLSLCVDTDEMELDGSNLQLPVADTGDPQTITCTDDELEVGGGATSQGADISYQWRPSQGGHIVSGANNATAIVDRAGNYELTVSSSVTGCSVSASVDIGEDREPPEVEIDHGTNDFYCSGRSLTLTAVGDADAWSWSTGESGQSIEVSSPDLYILEGLRTENGCIGMAELNIDERPTPQLNLGDTTLTVNSGEAVSIPVTANPPNARVEWSVKDIANLDETNSSYDASGTGDIEGTFYPISSRSPSGVTYLANSELRGCAGDTSQIVLLAYPDDLGFFIPEVFSPNGDGVNDEWIILVPEGESPDEYSVNVFDRRGRVVFQSDNLSVPWDGQNVADGVYYYVIFQENSDEFTRGAVALVGRDTQ